MAENSKIEWTNHTFNPWRGCTKVSPGCEHCYAETQSKRNPAVLGQWGKGKPRVLASEDMWRQPLKWNKVAELRHHEAAVIRAAGIESSRLAELEVRPRVFCASLADWLDEEVPIQWLGRLLALIYLTPHLDWLLLTKRPQNFQARIESTAARLSDNECEDLGSWAIDWMNGQAPHNIWLGTTVEDQTRANERIPQLLSISAQVRFLSCEPLLGPVDISENFWLRGQSRRQDKTLTPPGTAPKVEWVICGGESGPLARPMHPDWARSLRDQCAAAKVPFFFKQWGEWLPGCQYQEGDKERFKEKAQHSFSLDDHSWWVGKAMSGRLLDGIEHNEFPKLEGRAA